MIVWLIFIVCFWVGAIVIVWYLNWKSYKEYKKINFKKIKKLYFKDKEINSDWYKEGKNEGPE